MSQVATPAPEAAKKKGKGKLLIIMVAVLVLALGGGGAAYFFMGRGDAAKGKVAKKKADGHQSAGEHAEEAEEAEEGEGHEPAVVALPTFTVNLADKDAPRYLRTTVSLLVKDTEKAASLSGGGEHKSAGEPVRIAMARSAILELLTTKTAEELMTAEGKTALKKEIAARASEAFRFKVNDVLLAEFVVQ
ncbi:MAG: flagellar basal body-associated FliL family protein [Vicinamibacteraceae bacterium]